MLAFNASQSITGPENFFRLSIQSSMTTAKIPTRTTALLLTVSTIHRTKAYNILIHRRHRRRICSREAEEYSTNHQPQHGKHIYRISADAQIEWSSWESITPAGGQDALWHYIRDIQHEHGCVDDRVECSCAGDIEKTIDQTHAGRKKRRADGYIVFGMNMAPVA